MKKNINKKGFTLIELLAVIIILAVIMVFAVPALLDTANNAKKKATELYAERVGTKALEKATSDDMDGNFDSEGERYDFVTDLKLTDVGNYFGFVIVKSSTSEPSGYAVTIYLSDGKFCTSNEGVKLSNISSFSAHESGTNGIACADDDGDFDTSDDD